MNGKYLTENVQQSILSRPDVIRKLSSDLDVDKLTVRRMVLPSHKKHYRLVGEKTLKKIQKYLGLGIDEVLTEKGGIHA